MAGLCAPADWRYHGQAADWAAQNSGPQLNIGTEPSGGILDLCPHLS